MADLKPISPALRAAAQLDRVLVQALDRLAYPEQPMTGFAPYVAPQPAAPTTKRGTNPMGAAQIRSLSSVIKTALADIQREAETLAGDLTLEVASFKQTVQEGHAVKKEIRDAHAEFKATLGLGTNGAEDDTPQTGPLEPI